MNKITYISIFIYLGCLLNTFKTSAQDISLFQQFNGRYDYTALGNTLNTTENGPGGPCVINTSSSADLLLTADQTIVAAYLYWAGSDDGDFDIELNNIPVTASRTFSDSLTGDRDFFAAFADVTNIILAEGNGTYTVSEFDLTAVINPYCPTGTNFGGWAITVIYESPSLPLNQLNVYDGLQSVPDELEITLDNLNVFDNVGAKIGFIAWEGDQGLSVNESLRINGNIIQNLPLNPGNNAFNGTNSFTGASDLYNMDIDFYNIQNNISIGDTQATISLTSGQDFVMINNIITVLNSQLPDATVSIDSVDITCDSRDITLEYTIYNTNSTAILPANTAIAIYADGSLIGNDVTTTDIPIGGNIQQSITLTIPTTVSNTFTLSIAVDDDGTGTGVVDETNENNNSAASIIILPVSPTIPPLENLELCDTVANPIFDLTLQELNFLPGTFTFNYYESLDNAINGISPITNTENHTITASPTTIYIEVIDNLSLCRSISNFDLIILESPLLNQPDAIETCQTDDSFYTEFDLTINEQAISNESGLTFQYYETMIASDTFENEITTPEAFQNNTNPQTIYVTVRNQNGCINFTSFEIEVIECEILIPSGISPNGDGKNDGLNIQNLDAHPNFKLYIYNRLGTLIFEGNRNTPNWDGTPNRGTPRNKRLPTGTYFYVLYLNDADTETNGSLVKQTYSGWIYLSK